MANEKRLILNEYNRPYRCQRCGSSDMTFKGVGTYRCDKCGFVDYDDYGKVRNYVEANKGATTTEISMATGISQKAIHQMLRDEKFEVTADSRSFLKCLGCGAPIRSGNYCPNCARLAAAAEAKKKHDEERRQNRLQGFATAQQTDSGARRFTRDD